MHSDALHLESQHYLPIALPTTVLCTQVCWAVMMYIVYEQQQDSGYSWLKVCENSQGRVIKDTLTCFYFCFYFSFSSHGFGCDGDDDLRPLIVTSLSCPLLAAHLFLCPCLYSSLLQYLCKWIWFLLYSVQFLKYIHDLIWIEWCSYMHIHD